MPLSPSHHTPIFTHPYALLTLSFVYFPLILPRVVGLRVMPAVLRSSIPTREKWTNVNKLKIIPKRPKINSLATYFDSRHLLLLLYLLHHHHHLSHLLFHLLLYRPLWPHLSHQPQSHGPTSSLAVYCVGSQSRQTQLAGSTGTRVGD